MKKWILLVSILIGSSLQVCADETLHTYYEQNGDCYILIGDGAKKGVYSLHNLPTDTYSGTKPERLYDPGVAYGLSATQKWDSTANASIKNLWTFASAAPADGITTRPVTGDIERRVLVNGSMSVWGFTEQPNAIVHRIHSRVNSSTTGLGNHSNGTINSFFAGSDIPCNVNPRPVPGKPGYYYVRASTDYYHSADSRAWSPWTYVNSSGGFASPSGVRNDYPGDSNYYSRTNSLVDSGPSTGPWTNICCSGGTYGMSGWAHKVQQENLTATVVDMVLNRFQIGFHNASTGAVRDRSVANNVTVAVNGTANYRGECTDGCIRAQDGVALPGQASPVLQSAYSQVPMASGGTSYLYRRDVNATTYSLTGKSSYDVVVGDGTDTTCEHMGVSSKDANGNYIYLIGKRTVDNWLTDAGSTGMVINEVTDIAVSDQWWQKGGIVYVYDKTQSMVFAFTRDEESTTQDVPKEIYVKADGVLPDKIGADGFGALYTIRTEFDPPEISDTYFKDDSSYLSSCSVAGVDRDGIKYFRANFKQGVYKTVYKVPRETGVMEKISNRLKLGDNSFYRYYYTADQNISTKPKAWSGPFYQEGVSVNDNIKTELAVINSPTPPRPGDTNSVLDLIGPLVINTTTTPVFSVAAPSGTCSDCGGKSKFNTTDAAGNDILYCMQVENAPYFDTYGLNIANTETMQTINPDDGDSFVGKFPYTIKKDSIKYYWKIIQLVDKDHNATGRVLMDMEAEGKTGNSLLVIPSSLEGRLKIGVKMTYRFYDYTTLGVGKLASEKETTLYPKPENPPCVASVWKDGSRHNIDSDGYAWNEIEIVNTSEPIPADAGVLMAGTNYTTLSSFKPGPNTKGYGCNSSCGHDHCNKDIQHPTDTKFIIDGYSLCKHAKKDESTGDYSYSYNDDTDTINWGLYLRDTSYNYNHGIDRVSAMFNQLPPDPGDPKEVKSRDTRTWELGNLTWNVELKKGSDVIYRATPVSKNIPISSKDVDFDTSCKPYLTLSEMRNLFPLVSEPYSYHVKVEMNRPYSYYYFETVRIPVDPLNPAGESVEMHLDVPRVINLKISAEADIIVTDNDAPGEKVYKIQDVSVTGDTEGLVQGIHVKNPYFYATTGEAMTSQIAEIIVVDNNPFAGETITVSGDRTDKYHYKASDKKLSRLQICYNNDNQKARIYHNSALSSNYTPANIIANLDKDSNLPIDTNDSFGTAYNLTPTRLSKAEVLAEGIPYSKYLSYIKYSINATTLTGFSKVGGDFSKNMDYYRALPGASYKNLLFGIKYQEACYRAKPATGSDVGNILEYLTAPGQIVITDNDRPNGLIIAKQDKYTEAGSTELKKYYVPNFASADSNTKADYISAWRYIKGTSESERNGQEQIGNKTLTTLVKEIFAGMNNHPTQDATNALFPTEEPLETDIPVTFVATYSDNISAANYLRLTSYKIYKADGTELADTHERDTTEGKAIQYVFREPGDYYIELKFKDQAATTANPDFYNPISSVGSPVLTLNENTRTLYAFFTVKSTKLDLRIIERQNVER